MQAKSTLELADATGIVMDGAAGAARQADSVAQDSRGEDDVVNGMQ